MLDVMRNDSPAWNHTVHYHEVLLRALPNPCKTALDVGCGEGDFTRQLAALAEQVDAVDEAEEVLLRAKARAHGFQNIHFLPADVMSPSFHPSTSYDFISLLATLHHLPFTSALEKLKGLLNPGGVLGIIGLYRIHSLADYLTSVLALPTSWFYRLTRGLAPVNAPLQVPGMTLEEIRTQAAHLLPGATIQRLLFWRYSLVWKKPLASETPL